MQRSLNWNVRFDPTVRAALENLAALESRTAAAMVRVLVTEALRQRGLMPTPDGRMLADRGTTNTNALSAGEGGRNGE